MLDFGAGCGSSSAALAKFCGQVTAFEIDTRQQAAFETRMRLLSIQNATMTCGSPDYTVQACLEAVPNSDVIVLLAVVEHMLQNESEDFLRKIWRSMRPGSHLAIIETPNFLAYRDSHTFDKMFAHMIPDKYFLRWIKSQAPDTRFRDHFLDAATTGSEGELLEERQRKGVGFLPILLDIILEEDLNEVVVADGFDSAIEGWFPFNRDDERLVQMFSEENIPYPIGYARSVLSLVLEKPMSIERRGEIREWNSNQRKSVVERFSK